MSAGSNKKGKTYCEHRDTDAGFECNTGKQEPKHEFSP